MFNPYVYARTIDGQIGIVLSLALSLFFYASLIRYLRSPNRGYLVRLVLF
jgi:hypothetical protein